MHRNKYKMLRETYIYDTYIWTYLFTAATQIVNGLGIKMNSNTLFFRHGEETSLLPTCM